MLHKSKIIAVKTITAPEPHLGSLSVVQADQDLGFPIKRVYYIHGMEENAIRGEHAHKKIYQCLIAIHGSVTLHLEGKDGYHHIVLNSPSEGLIVPPGYWRKMTDFSKDSCLMVLASENYSEAEYIRDYDEFKQWLNGPVAPAKIPYLDLRERYNAFENELKYAAEEALQDARYILGPRVNDFEKAFAEYCGTQHCIGTGNGLDALELMLRACSVGREDEVIMCASGFIATPLAVMRLMAQPVFVDCLANGNIAPATIEAAITPKSKAIMLTHLYGMPADMDAIQKIAQKHDLLILEDSCQAHGSTYKGQKCGSLGDAAAFSFYPSKNLGAFGDGGCVTTNNPEIAEQIRLLRNYGSSKKYHHELVGFNSRLDDIQAGLLLQILPYLDSWNAKRNYLAGIYHKELSQLPQIRMLTPSTGYTSNWHVFPIFLTDGSRNGLAEYLAKQGIETNIHYPTPMHIQPCCSGLGYVQGDFPMTESICAEELSLPLDQFKKVEEIEYIAASIKRYYKE